MITNLQLEHHYFLWTGHMGIERPSTAIFVCVLERKRERERVLERERV